MEQAARPSSTGLKARGRLRRRILLRVGIILAIVAGTFVSFATLVLERLRVPTNAMAPALWGRTRQIVCPQCGYTFEVSASDEVDNVTGRATGRKVVGGLCPMCRCPSWRASGGLGPNGRAVTQSESLKLFRGDRFLVQKFAYYFGDPKRWDVAVFRYPGDTRVNFVKRIVGLPRETVRIHHGDVFVRRGEMAEFTIARKPPATIRAMLLPVHDNDYVPVNMFDLGWPARWQPEAGDVPGAWHTSSDYRSFETDGAGEAEAWLRYRHVVPSSRQWQGLEQGRLPADNPPKPRLIADFFAGNTDYSQWGSRYDTARPPEHLQLHWVGDLAVQCTMEVRGKSGEAILELVEGGRRMQCRIAVASGAATLSIDGLDTFRPAASTSVRGPGTYDILFANVDDQLLLWVDGTLVVFDAPSTYDPLGNTRPQEADLSPAGIASRRAAVSISHLRLFRDVYYIAYHADAGREVFFAGITDFDRDCFPSGRLTPDSVVELLSDPNEWDLFDKARSVEFQLEADQFFVLGDNSAQSRDSRLWPLDGIPYYVRGDLLIGKALYRYSPRLGVVR